MRPNTRKGIVMRIEISQRLKRTLKISFWVCLFLFCVLLCGVIPMGGLILCDKTSFWLAIPLFFAEVGSVGAAAFSYLVLRDDYEFFEKGKIE